MSLQNYLATTSDPGNSGQSVPLELSDINLRIIDPSISMIMFVTSSILK